MEPVLSPERVRRVFRGARWESGKGGRGLMKKFAAPQWGQRGSRRLLARASVGLATPPPALSKAVPCLSRLRLRPARFAVLSQVVNLHSKPTPHHTPPFQNSHLNSCLIVQLSPTFGGIIPGPKSKLQAPRSTTHLTSARAEHTLFRRRSSLSITVNWRAGAVASIDAPPPAPPEDAHALNTDLLDLVESAGGCD